MGLLQVMILVAVACGVREHWGRLAGDEPATNRFLKRWAIRGLIVPMAFWGIVNLGLFTRLPAFVPNLAVAQASNQPWGSLWIQSAFLGAVFIGIAWSAINYTWMALILARRASEQPEFRATAGIIGVPMLVCAIAIAYFGGWAYFTTAICALTLPLVHTTMNLGEKPPAVTSYGRAEGQMKFGKYEDAEIEVISQLERKENDFKGWMMLAELYATKYRRLDDAAEVVVDLCNDPSVKEVEISVACHKLADWQLEIGQNPGAARAAMDLVMKRLPGTHSAHMAELRLKQLPRTREDLLDQKKPRAIRLPALREQGEKPPALPMNDPAGKRAATIEANRLTARLQDNPNDHVTRERLAVILAEQLGHTNLAIDQLRSMLKLPDVPAERSAKWLAQIADWERHLNKNETKFRALLSELIRDYPNTSFALTARRQLDLIDQALQSVPAEKPERPKLRVDL